MSRPLRIQYKGAWYHVMNRGGEHRIIFRDKKDQEIFLNLLDEAFQMWDIEVHAYCLMPNHYHLLIRTPLANLSRAMRHINGIYTQCYNFRWKRDSQLFRGRFKAILIEKDSYLLEVARYIHCNPVKAKMAKLPQDYAGSSYCYFLGRKGKPSCLVTEMILGYFSKRLNKARKEFVEFTGAGVPKKLEEKLDAGRWPAVLGGDGFEEWVDANFIPRTKERDIIYPVPKNALTLKQVLGAVSEACELPWHKIKKAQSRDAAIGRKLAILALRCKLGLAYSEIARCVGGIDPSQISRLLHQERGALEKRVEWMRLTAEVEGTRVKI